MPLGPTSVVEFGECFPGMRSASAAWKRIVVLIAVVSFGVGEAWLTPALGSDTSSPSIAEMREAAEAGDAKAQCDLGGMYEWGRGVPQNYTEAVNWYRKAAEQGYARAQYDLGRMYEWGQGVPQDNAKALMWFRMAGEQEHSWAQYNLGLMYYHGRGVPQDYAEAFIWHRKAAESGDADAQAAVGGMYSEGLGVPQDYAEAVRWFRLAAEQGNAEAQYSLGVMYRLGQGVPQDYAQALTWYRMAAEQGDADAQVSLGAMYAQGKGVPQDYAQALKWFLMLAEQGHANAQFGLGVIYAEGGKGVPQDYVQALKWYRMAAEQGHAYAQCDLGGMYAQGQGVPQNDVEAYVWFSLSAAQGDETAARNRDNVARKMSRQEIVVGQQRAAAFVAKKEMADSRADEPLHSLPSATITTVPKGSGTGFFISDDGYLLTSFHVVAKADRLVVLTQAGTLSAVVVRSDSANDVALLKVLAKSQALPIVPSRAVALGNTVATVGFPNIGLQGFAPKLSRGDIAGLTGAGDDPGCFHVSLPVQPGNSGGALVNELGNVVGVGAGKLSV